MATRKSQNKKAKPQAAKKKLTSAKKLAKDKKSTKAAPVKKSTKGKVVAKVKAVPAKKSAKKGAGKTKPVVSKNTSVRKVSAQAVPKPKEKAAVKSRSNTFVLQEPKKKQNSAGSSRRLENLPVVFSPLDDRVVVQPVEASNVTAGGIIIPDSVNEKPQMGTIVAVGRGHRSAKGRVRPVDVKVGDRILFPKYAGDEIEIDGRKLLVLREGDVLGVTKA